MKNLFLFLVSLTMLAFICTSGAYAHTYTFIMKNNTHFKVRPIKEKTLLDTHENRERTLAAACHRFESDGVTFYQDVDPTQYLRLDKQHNVAFCPLAKVRLTLTYKV